MHCGASVVLTAACLWQYAEAMGELHITASVGGVAELCHLLGLLYRSDGRAQRVGRGKLH